jgi:hypothetical protein
MKMKISIILLLVASLLLLSALPVNAQPFVNDMISVVPEHLAIPFKSEFSINVTNLRNGSIWVFCLAQANITRINAPVFKTLLPNASYLYRFLSPDINASEIPTGAFSEVYSIFFGAVDSQATAFQTMEVVLDITTVEWINLRLQELTIQNAELLRQIQMVLDRASYNNILVIAVVVSNVFWVAIVVSLKVYSRKPQAVAQETPS